MSTNGFVFAAKTSDVPNSSQVTVEIDNTMVVIVNQQGEYFCLDDVCTHDGGTLSDGDFEEGCLICSRHGAKFDVRTGKPLCMPATQPTRTHSVRIQGDDIQVKLSD